MMDNRKTARNMMVVGLIIGFGMMATSLVGARENTGVLLAGSILVLYCFGQWLVVGYWQKIQSDWSALAHSLTQMEKTISEMPKMFEAFIMATATQTAGINEKGMLSANENAKENTLAILESSSQIIAKSLAEGLKAPSQSLYESAISLGANALSLISKAEDVFSRLAHSTSELEKGARERGIEVLDRIAAIESQNMQETSKLRDGIFSGFAEMHKVWEGRSIEREESASHRQAEMMELWTRAGSAALDEIRIVRDAAAQQWSSQQETQEKRHRGIIEEIEKKSAEVMERQTRELSSSTHGLLEQWHRSMSDLVQGFSSQAEMFLQSSRELSTSVRDSNRSTADSLQNLISEVEEKSIRGNAERLSELLENHRLMTEGHHKVVKETRDGLEVQSKLALEITEKVELLTRGLQESGQSFKDASHLLQTNQAEMQAGIGMLNSGLASLLDKLEQEKESGAEESGFIDRLNTSLGAFHERAAEILIENSLKTQEILMEVLSVGSSNGRSPLAAAPTNPISE